MWVVSPTAPAEVHKHCGLSLGGRRLGEPTDKLLLATGGGPTICLPLFVRKVLKVVCAPTRLRSLAEGAVVTGAASGIGRGLAGAFAQQGARVVLADIEEAPLAEVGRALEAELDVWRRRPPVG